MASTPGAETDAFERTADIMQNFPENLLVLVFYFFFFSFFCFYVSTV